jgi:capsid protein
MSDDDDNKRFKEYFTAWADNRLVCDRSAKLNFWEKQGQTVTHLIRDGESNEVQQKSRHGTPQLLKVDSLFVGGTGSPTSAGDFEVIDGVKVDAYGKALGYYVQVKGDRKFQYVSANNFNHVALFKEADQQRGISWLAGGMNNGRDIVDLTSLEMQAAKIHSALAVLVKRKEGGTKSLKETFDNGGEATTSDIEIDGAQMIDTKGDIEDVDLLTSNRPNLDVIAMIRALVRDICWNLGVPFEWGWDITATKAANTRFVTADVNIFLSKIQRILVSRFCQPTYTWVIASALKQYRETGGRMGLAPAKDPNWWKCDWTTPEKVTVDIGRDGKLLKDLRNEGLLSDERYFYALGQDEEVEKRSMIQTIKRDMERCKDAGIPYEYLRQSLLSKALINTPDETD